MMATKTKREAKEVAGTAIKEALEMDAYNYLSNQAAVLLDAISVEVEQWGYTPEQVRHEVSRAVGPERQALAQRAYLAACYIKRVTEYTTA